jgi:hypothetical protein
MIVTNKHNLPDPYFKACQRDSHPRFDMTEFSVTELNKGDKEILLTRRHWNELEQDCSDMVWAVFGTAVHKVFEAKEGDDEIAEERVSTFLDTEHGKVRLSGGFDLYNASEQCLTDYKTTKVFSYQMKMQEGVDSEWARQLRAYWWLLSKNGFPVKRARNIILLTDFSKTNAKRDPAYPQTPIVTLDWKFGVMNGEEAASIEEEFTGKVEAILKASELKDDDIAPCTKEQRWERGECFAVMKKGRKTALKRFSNEFEAEAMAAASPDLYVEHRPGVSVKCEDYCLCKAYCNYYRDVVAGRQEAEGGAE